MDVLFHDITLEIDPDYIAESPSEITEQIDEYRNGTRREFSLTIDYPENFTGSVMQAMNAIPYGETRTYGELATTLDTAPIAVGSACGRNPIPIIIPCHRVIGADGIGGYSAGGCRSLELKQQLLKHEAATDP